jgi:hypothetical protein
VKQFAEVDTKLPRHDSSTSGYRRDGQLSDMPEESGYRFVAYASPYLFWAIVMGLSAGILLV